MGLSPVKEAVPKWLKGLIVPGVNSESEVTIEPLMPERYNRT